MAVALSGVKMCQPQMKAAGNLYKKTVFYFVWLCFVVEHLRLDLVSTDWWWSLIVGAWACRARPSTAFERARKQQVQRYLSGRPARRDHRRGLRSVVDNNYLGRRVASLGNVTQGWLSFLWCFEALFTNSRGLWSCGRRVRRWATHGAQRRVGYGRTRCAEGASSTCPQHPGAQRPAPAAQCFSVLPALTFGPFPLRRCATDPGSTLSCALSRRAPE